MELPGGDSGAPRGAGWGSQCGIGTGQALQKGGGRRSEDRMLVLGTGLEDLVGQSEATARSRTFLSCGKEPAWGAAWERVGRCRSGWKLERLPQGSRLGPVEAPWATEPWEAASGGARPSPQTRGCEGAARGFRAWISRRADPSPLRAPPPGRGPAWPAICFASTPTQPPGPPWPQECSGGGGLGLAWRGGGRDRRGPCLSSSAVLPLGVGAGGSGGTLELSKA